MKSKYLINNKYVTMIDVVDEFDTSESMFISNLAKKIRKKQISFKVIEIDRGVKDLKVFQKIPMLMIGDKKDVEDFKLNDYSMSVLDNKLRSITRKLIPLSANKDILSKHDFYVEEKSYNINDLELNNKLFIEEESPFKVFNFGDYLFIAPNMAFMYFESEEIKNKESGRDLKVIKKTYLNKSSFRDALLCRRTDLWNNIFKFIRNIPQKYNDENITVVFFKEIISSGIFVSFMSKKYIDIIENKKILPFKISENNKFSLKSEDEISDEFKTLEEEMKEYENVKKEFDKVKELLRAKGEIWLSLDLIEKINNKWKIWLNPIDDNIYRYGWYELEDLYNWLKGEGKILKK